MVHWMSTTSKNSVVQTQVPPTTNARLLKLAMSLKEDFTSTTFMEKGGNGALDRTQSLPTWLGKVKQLRMPLSWANAYQKTMRLYICPPLGGRESETRDALVWKKHWNLQIVGEDALKDSTRWYPYRCEVKEGDIPGKVTPKGEKDLQLKNVSCMLSSETSLVKVILLRVPSRCLKRWCYSDVKTLDVQWDELQSVLTCCLCPHRSKT